jgi:glycosyltransferase involved in cell wall biosynthesis
MKFSPEGCRRALERSGYATLALLKEAGRFPIRGSVPFFGFLRRGRTTAAFLKARGLAALFVTSPLHNGILYVCSGHIPLWYCRREKRRGVKLVVNQNGVYYPGWYGADYAAANERHLAGFYREADQIIYQSDFCKAAARRYLGEPPCPHVVWHNPVDTTRFSPAFDRAFDRRAPVFLATGNFYGRVKEARLRLLLEAFALVRRQLPRARLLVAGSLAPELKPLAGEAGPGVGFSGPYAYEQAPALYRRGDIYLNTQFNDSCPSAVLEAMSSGLPVVHLGCGGTPELTGAAGIAVPVTPSWEHFVYPAPEQYAAAMLEALGRRRELSILARQRCLKRFDLALWKRRHAELFGRLPG